MWNDAGVRRDAEASGAHHDRFGFTDAKGVEWKVAWRTVPERGGRIALDFASSTGKRRSAEIKAADLEELRGLGDMGWRALLANAALIEME